MAQDTRDEEELLETVRAEDNSVLEIVKLSDPAKIHDGLCMLLKLHSIRTDTTNAGANNYLGANGCGTAPAAHWETTSLTVPGCGVSGCYAAHDVCGPVPPGMRATGNTRNFTDSFGGAWGDWLGQATTSSTQVCRTFNQHSHNVQRVVSFQYEVTPITN